MNAVAVLFPGSLGDLVCCLPCLRALRARHRGAQVRLFVNRALHEIAAMAGVADRILPIDGGGLAALFGDAPRPRVRELEGVVRVYSWFGSGDTTFRNRLAELVPEAQFVPFDRSADGEEHVTSWWLKELGFSARPPVHLAAPGAAGPVLEWLAAHGLSPQRLLVVHTGAGSPAKRWERKGFASVAERWCAAGGGVVEIVGPAESGSPPLLAGVPRAIEWRFSRLCALLAVAERYLGNDSGVSHLAGAAGARGVVLFGPTAPRRWRPLGGHLRAVRAGRLDCRSLSPERVFAALTRPVTRPAP